MKEIDDGGPAFPRARSVRPDDERNEGMTLRDYFAGQALIGLLGNGYPNNTDGAHYAKAAYHYADAMIAARNGDGGGA